MKDLKNILVNSDLTVKDTLKRMDQVGEKTIFVSDNNKKLLGSVTDGDIRRWILKEGDLTVNITNVMNPKPFCLSEGETKENAKKIMIDNDIECIPIVNKNKEIISAYWWLDFFQGKETSVNKINAPVVIMAGGRGERLHPFTKVLPKPLIPIGDKPIIELIIDKFLYYGAKNYYVSINYKANLIKAYFKDLEKDYNISFVEEDKPLGTGGSLKLLKGKIDSTFYVSNCDILIDADYYDIYKFHKESQNKITLITSLKHYLIPYGVCEISNGGQLNEINEKPEYDLLVNTGLYILEPEMLDEIPDNKFYHITHLINDVMAKNYKVGVYPVSDQSWLDMGEWGELQKMMNKFGVL